MFENLLEKKKKTFGLDIGYNTLKVVQLKKSGQGFYLIGYNEVEIPAASVQKNGIKGKAEIAKMVQKATASAKPHSIPAKAVCSALPESLVFTKIIHLPQMKKQELENAVPHEVAEFFPMPLNEMNLDWQILNPNQTNKDGKKELEILVIAAPKTLVNDFMEIVTASGLELVSLETKPIAAARAVLDPEDKDSTVLVDIGAETSGISIIEEDLVKITGTVKSGSNAISRALTQALKIKPEEAERMKKTEGLELGKRDAKNIAILRAIKPILEEIEKMTKYYQTRLKKEAKINQIKLLGGGARMPNLAAFIQKELNITTGVANPWLKVKNRPNELVPSSEALKYSTALGLAMREI